MYKPKQNCGMCFGTGYGDYDYDRPPRNLDVKCHCWEEVKDTMKTDGRDAPREQSAPSEIVPTPASPAATPRTDAALNVYDCNADEDVVSADFARTLERELNAREAQIRARLESSPSATGTTVQDAQAIVSSCCELFDCRPSELREKVAELKGTSAPVEAGTTDYKALYYELIYQVGMKHPGETRHQTALRYLKLAEEPSNSAACDPRMKGGAQS